MHDDAGTSESADFLSGGGEIAERIRQFDWVKTPLGPIETWPVSLKTTIGLILRSPVPIVTLWGDAGTMIYNDAYSGFAGARHPALLGSAVREGWPEVADFNDNVMRVGLAGRTLSYKDQELTLYRAGHPEQVFMNLDYSPVIGESGKPIGIIAIVIETTELVAAQRRLVAEAQQRQDERDRQQHLFEQAPGFIVIMRGPEHVVEFVNDAHRQVFNSGDWVGWPIRGAFPSIEGQGFFEALDEVYTTGRTLEFNATPVDFKTSPEAPSLRHYLTFFYAPLYGDDGVITGVFCEGFDVTQQHVAQQRIAALFRLGDAIREIDDPVEIAYVASEMLGNELKVSRVGYGTVDPSDDSFTVVRDWNAPGVQSIAGVLNLRDFGDFVDDLKLGKFIVIDDVLRDPRTASGASNLIARSARSFVNVAVIERTEAVAVFYVNHSEVHDWSADELELIRDVAERVRSAVQRRSAEAAVRENEERLRFLDGLGRETANATNADDILSTTTRMLGEYLGVAVCAYADMDDDGDHFTIRGDWSAPGSSSIVGHYSLADFGVLAVKNLGSGLPLVINDNLNELPPEEAAAFQSIGIGSTICMPQVKEGRLTALMAVHDRGPRVWAEHELALLREVTERSWAHIARVRSEAEVRERDAQFRTLAQAMPNHVWTARPDGHLDWFNEQVYAYSGAERDTLVGQGWASMVHPDDVATAVTDWQDALASGAAYQTEFRLRRHDGVYRWHLARAVPLLDATKQIVRWVGTNTDIDDQKNAEVLLEDRLAERTAALAETGERLQQSQKMEAIGNLTGGMAHDFNNLLMAVLGSLELLRKRVTDEPVSLRLIDNAIEGAKRGASLTGRMLAFARRQDLKSERIDPKSLVDGIKELVQRTIGPLISVETTFPAQMSGVEADANQLESALLNLAVNARDAMPEGGHLTISGREAIRQAEHGLPAGRYVCLAVRDTGEGMDEATLKRATEPFFTTKGVGRGTGLGLSMVYGLAEQLGGRLLLSSRLGVGTTAEIWLPAHDSVAAATPVAPQELPATPSTHVGPRRVLAVDDDALVLMSTAAMLEDFGCTVVEAYSAAAALDALEAQSFDLVITDHAMPKMTGSQLALEIRKRWPGLPIILATGYAELPEGTDLGLPRLSKPFSQRDLETAVLSAAPTPPRAGDASDGSIP